MMGKTCGMDQHNASGYDGRSSSWRRPADWTHRRVTDAERVVLSKGRQTLYRPGGRDVLRRTGYASSRPQIGEGPMISSPPQGRQGQEGSRGHQHQNFRLTEDIRAAADIAHGTGASGRRVRTPVKWGTDPAARRYWTLNRRRRWGGNRRPPELRRPQA